MFIAARHGGKLSGLGLRGLVFRPSSAMNQLCDMRQLFNWSGPRFLHLFKEGRPLRARSSLPGGTQCDPNAKSRQLVTLHVAGEGSPVPKEKNVANHFCSAHSFMEFVCSQDLFNPNVSPLLLAI